MAIHKKSLPIRHATAILAIGLATACASPTDAATAERVSSTSTQPPAAAISTPSTPSTVAAISEPTTTTTTTTIPPASTMCSASDSIDGISVPVFWEVGEQRKLEVRIGRENSNQPIQTDGFSVTPVTVTALEVDESGILFEWLADETDLSQIGVPPSAMAEVEDFFSDVPRERVVYRLNRWGEWVGVENTPEIRENALKIMDVLAQITALTNDSPDSTAAAEQARDVFSSMDDESLALVFAERPMAYHYFDGISLDEGQEITATGELPNAFGGRAFPATSTIRHQVEPDRDNCELVDELTIPDPESFTTILFDTLSAFGREIDESDQAEIDSLAGSFDVRTSVLLQFDAGTALVRQVTTTQEITAEEGKRVDTTIITDVTDR